MITARFLEPAESEVAEAIAYFDQQRAGLGDRFERDLLRAITLAMEHPQIGSPLSKRTRKLRLRTFRYNVIYAADAEEIVIVAVAHQRRRPGYWRSRLATF